MNREVALATEAVRARTRPAISSAPAGPTRHDAAGLRSLLLWQRGSALAKLVVAVHPAVRTLCSYVLALFYTWHFLGCMYWRISSPPGSTAWSPPPRYATASYAEQYLYSVYWAVGVSSGTATFPHPSSMASLLYTLWTMVSGLFATGLIIGSLASLVSSLSARHHEQSTRLQQIRSYLRYKRGECLWPREPTTKLGSWECPLQPLAIPTTTSPHARRLATTSSPLNLCDVRVPTLRSLVRLPCSPAHAQECDTGVL